MAKRLIMTGWGLPEYAPAAAMLLRCAFKCTAEVMGVSQRHLPIALKKCEEMIESLEARNEEINRQFSLSEISMNAVKLKWLAEEQQQIASRLEELYIQWEALS